MRVDVEGTGMTVRVDVRVRCWLVVLELEGELVWLLLLVVEFEEIFGRREDWAAVAVALAAWMREIRARILDMKGVRRVVALMACVRSGSVPG